MTNKNTVVLCNDMPLLLTSVKRNESGDVISGDVINGGWKLVIEDCLIKAFDYHGNLVSELPLKTMIEKTIPEGVTGDYNFIIEASLRGES